MLTCPMCGWPPAGCLSVTSQRTGNTRHTWQCLCTRLRGTTHRLGGPLVWSFRYASFRPKHWHPVSPEWAARHGFTTDDSEETYHEVVLLARAEEVLES